MKKAVFIIAAAALILLAAAAPALAHHGGGMMYKNNTHWNDQCFVSESGSCVYAENCTNGEDCQNDCHFTCMKNAKEERGQTTTAGHHMRGAHHAGNR